MAGRGELTPQVQLVATRCLGREITQTELRLMPYLQYLLINERRIDPNRIKPEERRVLRQWRDAGWLEGGAGSTLRVSKSFYLAIAEVLWLAYVTYDEPLSASDEEGRHGSDAGVSGAQENP